MVQDFARLELWKILVKPMSFRNSGIRPATAFRRSSAGSPTLLAVLAFVGLIAAAPTADAIDLGDLKIPPSRIPNWNPGVEGGVPDTSAWPTIDATDYGAVPDDGKSDAAAINKAMAHAASLGGNQVVTLPAGTYRFEELEWIQMRSNVVLRGAGFDQTIITGDSGYGGPETGGVRGGIKFVGTLGSAVKVTNSSLPEGTDTITVSSPSSFSVGDWVYMTQDNDPSYVQNPAGGKLYMDHIFKVSAMSGSQITMDRPIRHDFNPAMSPRVMKMKVVENSGLEDLTAQFDSDFQYSGCTASPASKCYDHPGGAPVMMVGAVNCWAKNIHFTNGGNYNFTMWFSARNTIESSQFDTVLATERSIQTGADPTSNYSIEVGEGAEDNLLTNNISVNNLTVINLARGASGNVYSYNYITGTTPYIRKGIMFHGQYPHDNLIEGNDTYALIEIGDNYWGQQGPNNTAFRNRMRGKGYMAQNKFNDGFVVDHFNVILNTAFTYFTKNYCQPNVYGANDEGRCRDFDATTTNLWAERNLSRDTRIDGSPNADSKYGWVVRDKEPTSTFIDTTTVSSKPPTSWSGLRFPASLYLTGPPDFWPAGKPWPAIGADVDDFTSGKLEKLPAQLRYEAWKTGSTGSQPTPPEPLPAPVLLQ